MRIVMDDERHRKEFEEVRKLCPWRIGEKCKPVLYSYTQKELRDCTQNNCTPYYFKKFFEGK
jgi:hypothetical protein